MSLPHRGLLYCLAFLLSTSMVHAQNIPATVTEVPNDPALGHPFDAAAYLATPENLADSGYQEQEFIFSGNANVYAYNSYAGILKGGTKIVANGPYTDRMLIRRPIDPRQFSGNVVLEVINGALSADFPTSWAQASGQIIRHGDIWVAVTSRDYAITALKNFNPVRYASLSFANPQQDSNPHSCNANANELGLFYDILTQTAQLLRQPNEPLNPLAGLPVKRIYAWGYSQGALILTTYLNAIAPRLGHDPFDGYVVAGGLGGFALSNCSSLVQSDLHALTPNSRSAAIFQIQTTSEVAVLPNAFPARRDSDAVNNRYRLYEIAGGGHLDKLLFDHLPPTREDMRAAGNFDIDSAIAGCKFGGLINPFPSNYIYDNLLAKMEAWVELGVLPPHASVLFNGGTQSAPIGGVRSPAVDVPTADFNYNHNGSLLTILNNTVSPAVILCSFVMTQTPYPAWRNSLLYSTHANYVNKVSQSAQQLFKSGFLTDYDVQAIIEQAQAAKIP